MSGMNLKWSLNEERVSFSALCQENLYCEQIHLDENKSHCLPCLKNSKRQRAGHFILDCYHHKLHIRVCWSSRSHCSFLLAHILSLANNAVFLGVKRVHAWAICALFWRWMRCSLRSQWWTRGQGSLYRASRQAGHIGHMAYYGRRCHVIDDTFSFLGFS